MSNAYENDFPIGKIILIVSAILAAITLYLVETNAINAAKALNIQEFGNGLVILVLVGVALVIGAWFWNAIFGNNRQ